MDIILLILEMCETFVCVFNKLSFRPSADVFFFCQAPDTGAEGIDKLIEVLKASTYKPKRDSTGPFIFSVDHCFSIRGQGTVMTGTALSGAVNINDVIF